jgi:hypothetical protein
VSGRTRHIEVKQYFLRELKEQGIIKIVWRSGDLVMRWQVIYLPRTCRRHYLSIMDISSMVRTNIIMDQRTRKESRKKLDLSLLNARESMISIIMCLMI